MGAQTYSSLFTIYDKKCEINLNILHKKEENQIIEKRGPLGKQLNSLKKTFLKLIDINQKYLSS